LKNNKLLISIVTLLFLTTSQLIARQSNSSAIGFGEKHLVPSNILGGDQEVNVSIPESFHEASNHHTYPLILLLEDEFFHVVSGVVKHLASVNRIPEAIVVSLKEGPVIPKLYTNNSDFWPVDWKQIPFGKSPDNFVHFLEQELFPYFEKHFRANDFRIVIGTSGSAMFALHTFTKEAQLFDAHIAIAAGDVLGMGYKEGESMIDLFERDLKKTPDIKRHLYVTSADSDAAIAPMIARNLLELRQRLSPYQSESFKLISKIFPGENHYGVVLPAIGEALNMIFPKNLWSVNYRELSREKGKAMKNIDSTYQALSLRYGFNILPMAERWNSINSLRWVGLNLLQEDRHAEALEVLKRRASYRPQSPHARQDLSKAFEANNLPEEAIKEQQIAWQKASDSKMDPTDFLNRLNELNKRAGNEPTLSKPLMAKSLSKKELRMVFYRYNQLRNKVFAKGSTVTKVDELYSFYTDDFTYNHPKYGGIYSRKLLYDNTVKYVKSGVYGDSPFRHILSTIVGLDTIVIEEQYENDQKTTMTLYKFRGDKICYIEEFW